MSKLFEKKKAIELRKRGLSYNEIRQRVIVAKSTLSLWLRSVGMAKRHIRRITEKQRRTQKLAVEKWHSIKVEKTLRIKKEAQSEIKFLSKKERWLIGIALYWAEGSKEKEKGVCVQFSNSDPKMIRFFREWLLNYLKIQPTDIIYTLYIHEKSKNIGNAITFWADLLQIDVSEIKIYFKKHNPSPKRKNINENYIGLIRLVVKRSIDMNRKIDGWINGIINSTKLIGE